MIGGPRKPRLIAMLPARNEGWILGCTARALLMWVDYLIILEHASIDNTRDVACEVMCENPDRMSVLTENGSTWEEMRHRQKLLNEARLEQATHVVFVDADEILTANLLPSIRQMVIDCPPGRVLQLPWIQLSGSMLTYINAGQWAQQGASMAVKDQPEWKWEQPGYDHHHRHPAGLPINPYCPAGSGFLGPRNGGLMHLQMVDHRRLKAKHALYVMNETIRWPEIREPHRFRTRAEELNAQYGPTVTGALGPIGQVPVEWLNYPTELLSRIDWDAEPWQEKECQRLIDEHGALKFAGLDLYGVV